MGIVNRLRSRSGAPQNRPACRRCQRCRKLWRRSGDSSLIWRQKKTSSIYKILYIIYILVPASPSISVRRLALYINWWALYINWWALYINWWELCINWWGLYRKWLVAIYRVLWEMVGAIYMKYWQHWISSKKEETISAKVVS